MSGQFEALWAEATSSGDPAAQQAEQLAAGALSGPGRTTVTGMLTGSGQQFVDWSRSYRLFSRGRFDPNQLLDGALQQAAALAGPEGPLLAHMDDTQVRKTGRKIPGAGWWRDPLGPPFRTNLIWGQRFLQCSMAVAAPDGSGASRAVPVTFHHSPTPAKPSKRAEPQQWTEYEQARKACRISQVGAEQLAALRERLDAQGYGERRLVVSVDGGYTNRTVLRALPERTTLIGRIRKDAKLYALPQPYEGRGRRRVYGPRVPTPEQVRQDPDQPWQTIKAYAAGRCHDFQVKRLVGLRSKIAGGQLDLQLMVIRPLAYRKSAGSRLQYRKPAYLICTDPAMPAAQLLQAYLARWEIEVNFREQKTVMGLGQAQVRTARSAEALPCFLTGVYSLLLLAGERLARRHGPDQLGLPRPKWYPIRPGSRFTTGDLLGRWRAEQWAQASRVNFDSFVRQLQQTRTQQKAEHPALSAFMYMRN